MSSFSFIPVLNVYGYEMIWKQCIFIINAQGNDTAAGAVLKYMISNVEEVLIKFTNLRYNRRDI